MGSIWPRFILANGMGRSERLDLCKLEINGYNCHRSNEVRLVDFILLRGAELMIQNIDSLTS